jgi:NADPH:quinone reductase-like Zn-dependent oxidoreductase
MRAMIYRRYGPADVLRLEDAARPVPGRGEVLVRMRAAGVNPLDSHLMRGVGFAFGRPKPTVPGRDAAGVVEEVGADVADFAPGDPVFGICLGAFAELAATPAASLARKPAGVSFEQAASLPIAGLTALQGLRDAGRLRAGQKVLVTGASGGIGTLAVQIARSLGAEVTATCSAGNADLVRSLGAGRVIDYARQDFTAESERYDLIFDLVGDRPFGVLRRALARDGRIVGVGILGAGGPPRGAWIARWAARTLAGFLRSRFTRQKFGLYVAKVRREDLDELAALVESGRMAPVIAARYPLEQADEAVRHVATGRARGKIIISMGG